MPGQYYDPETDLFENFHRYYDATTGRYLEPDPLWKYPEKLVPRMATGQFDPVYAYAQNDPVVNSDPDGNIVHAETSTSGDAVRKLCLSNTAAGQQCRDLARNQNTTWDIQEKTAEQDSRLKSAGGALTEVLKATYDQATKKYTPTLIRTEIDFSRATSDSVKQAAHVTVMTPEMVVLHEGGHSWADSHGFWTPTMGPGHNPGPLIDKMQRQVPLNWENTVRSPHAPRTYHVMSWDPPR